MTAFGSPCFYCGARPDIECSHRPADETYQPPQPMKESVPSGTRIGSGYNFRTRKFKNKPPA